MNRNDKARRIRVQLTKLAALNGSLSVNELRIVLALERIVARLVQYKDLDRHLVYKGGFVLMKVLGSDRFTRDLDALGIGIEKAEVEKLAPKALAADIEDGFWFGDVNIESLDEQGEYGALRFNCAYQLGEPNIERLEKLSRIHFDVGFGDTIPTRLETTKSKSLIQGERPISWKVYPPEYIFSEKLQTLVQRASANSRAKDIYDLTLLFKKCQDKMTLSKAVKATFAKRGTELPDSFHEFAKNLNLKQISASWRSVRLTGDQTFEKVWGEVTAMLEDFDQTFKRSD